MPFRVKRLPLNWVSMARSFPALGAFVALAVLTGCPDKTLPQPDVTSIHRPVTETPEGLLIAPDEPEPIDRQYDHILAPNRVTIEAAGYSFRFPLGWGEADEPPAATIEVYLIKDKGAASIAIERRSTRIKRFQEWRAATDNMVAHVLGSLREPRILLRRIDSLHGAVIFELEHTYLSQGTYLYSRKVAWYAGTDIITANFNVPLDRKETELPAFLAFVQEFRLLHPERSHLDVVEPDYIGEWRDPNRPGLIVPVQRGFQRNDPPRRDGHESAIIARWVESQTVSLTLAEHKIQPTNLESYGTYQVEVLKQAGHSDIEPQVLDIGDDKKAFRLRFTSKPAASPVGVKDPGVPQKSDLIIVAGSDRWYQLMFSADAEAFPYFDRMVMDIASRAKWP